MKKAFAFKYIFLVVVFLTLLVGSLFLWSAGSLNSGPLQPRSFSTLERSKVLNRLTVLTWNTSYFYGTGSEGPGYKTRSQGDYQSRLNQAILLVKELNADLIFLQEVDFHSKRSYYVNQARQMAEELGYHWIELSSWNNRYVPFPYWPFSNQFKRVDNGGAILSRFPLKKIEGFLFDHPRSKPWWYNHFYPYRYMMSAEISLGNRRRLRVINTHLEAFDQKARLKQIEKIVKYLRSLPGPYLLAGDFNMLPVGSDKDHGFINYPDDDYRGDKSFSVLTEPLGISPQSLEKTFPSDHPDRKLDYIFTSVKASDCRVVKTTLSDHLPLLCEFKTNLFAQ